MSENGSNDRKGYATRMVQVIVQFVVLAALMFVAAGTLRWAWGWAYVGLSAGILIVNSQIVPREVAVERGKGHKGNVKKWDRVVTTAMAIPALAVPLLSGLDKRWGWSPSLPALLHVAGLVLVVVGQGIFTWAMTANKFFSTMVRLQEERDHAVASGGPYRYVRHPGYVGYVIATFGTALGLGSLWALIPSGLVAALMVVRTALEDRTLREELPGYADYAQQVRFRLVPGVW